MGEEGKAKLPDVRNLPRRCDTDQMHRRLAQILPRYRDDRRQVEYEIQNWLKRYRLMGLRLPIVRIPVVVHVVYHHSSENISDAQIHSQIAVLNADFRMSNADSGLVPAPFKPVRADTRIEFALATRAPDCTPTSGITRTHTATDLFEFGETFERMLKTTAGGGHDPWPREQYLNIWVCNYELPGYARYPTVADPSLDGVIITHWAFGTTGTASAPFDKGRTATHEVAHWLSLLHLWGDDDDDAAVCARSDEVADTPTQRGPNGGCPAFPHVTCGNAPNGDMFMNYLDYVDDRCMFMFTAGQANRMNACLQTLRVSILSSDGLIPPPAGGGPDLWSRNSPLDVGAEPDTSSGPMVFLSDDIWVRRAADGFANDDHQNPEHRQYGLPNYVYVRVRNRGCAAAGPQAGLLKLYWAKASLSLSWPAPWDGSVTAPAPMGGLIGARTVAVSGGGEQIYEFPWVPPNPAAYTMLGAGQKYFALLARIETGPAPHYGMTYPETANLMANVRNNNNIVCKCVTVIDGIDVVRFALVLSNFSNRKSFFAVQFRVPEDTPSLFEWGRLAAVRSGDRIAVSASTGMLEPIALAARESTAVDFEFTPGKEIPGARVFALDAIQWSERKEPLGGQRFYFKTGPRAGEFEWDRNLGLFDGVSWRTAAHE